MQILRSLILFFVVGPAIAESQTDLLSMEYTAAPGSLMRGQFRPTNFTILASGIDGTLRSFDVRNGQTVKKGDVIAEFACEEEESASQIAEARVDAASKNLEVNQRLDAYKNVSELELVMSEAELRIARAEFRQAAAILKKCRVIAPFNATVISKMAEAHQYVKTGEPLIEIVGTEDLEIEMVLPSMNVLEYYQGRTFVIHVDETRQNHEAVVDRVVNVIDPVSQTIRVIGRLTDDNSGLMPGMSGRVEFTQE